MKLSKTEQKLMEKVREYERYSVETGYGRGPNGGRISFGHRDKEAMYKLQAKGLIKIVARHPWEHTRLGNKQHGNQFVFTLA